MKNITMFLIASCPYCKAAFDCMDQLFDENSKYKSLVIERIDENIHPDIAGKYDYYYVPAFYVEGEKLHEGAASLEIIRRVFDAALE